MIKVDQNYRICIPSHIRQKLHINKEDKVDIFINEKGNIEIKTNHVDYKEIYDKLNEIFNSDMSNNDVIDAMSKYF